VTRDDLGMDAHRPVDIALADREFAFHEFVAFNNGHFAVFRASGAGDGPWEMHPDTDELLFALQGSVTVELFGDAGKERVALTAGSLLVVPRGRWHRHVDADNLVELYHTPGQSLGCDDPASASENDIR
jgi:mannose-6-phosphate isomerase-like protein (cupin superfamily)